MSHILVFRPEVVVSASSVKAFMHSQRVTEPPAGWFRSPREAWLDARDRLVWLAKECAQQANNINEVVEKNY